MIVVVLDSYAVVVDDVVVAVVSLLAADSAVAVPADLVAVFVVVGFVVSVGFCCGGTSWRICSYSS
jgi:hypothetical protein